MGWNLTNIQLPVAPNVRTRKRQQAVVAEPGMIPFLEAGIITAAEHNNPEWMALLANWLCAVGCLRHRHITKSSPQRLSASTVHAWCSQGKQARSRNGFTWSAPCRVHQWFSVGSESDRRSKSCPKRSSRPVVWPSTGKGSPTLSRRSRRRPSSSSRTMSMMRGISQHTHGDGWHLQWVCSRPSRTWS